jgi:hypothetical protein
LRFGHGLLQLEDERGRGDEARFTRRGVDGDEALTGSGAPRRKRGGVESDVLDGADEEIEDELEATARARAEVEQARRENQAGLKNSRTDELGRALP